MSSRSCCRPRRSATSSARSRTLAPRSPATRDSRRSSASSSSCARRAASTSRATSAPTIERRIAQRLAEAPAHAALDEYSAYLVEHSDEASDALRGSADPRHASSFATAACSSGSPRACSRDLIANKPPNAPIRVWVPGLLDGRGGLLARDPARSSCSASAGRRSRCSAPTSARRAIETARRGRYSDAIADAGQRRRGSRDSSAATTVATGSIAGIRERCVFVRHDLAPDPPFSKLDLVSCRNVLIYLGSVAAAARDPDDALRARTNRAICVLGRAETIAGFETLFDADRRRRSDLRAQADRRRAGADAFRSAGAARPSARRSRRRCARDPRSTSSATSITCCSRATRRPACSSTTTSTSCSFAAAPAAYLEPPPGQPQLNLLRMARERPRRPRSRSRSQRARRDTTRRSGSENVVDPRTRPRRTASTSRSCRCAASTEAKRYFLVVFEESRPTCAPAPRARARPQARDASSELVRVRQELAATKEYLHSVVTQHLATSEELGLTNEELQSSNEELQSSNEELQTAKEELQSDERRARDRQRRAPARQRAAPRGQRRSRQRARRASTSRSSSSTPSATSAASRRRARR